MTFLQNVKNISGHFRRSIGDSKREEDEEGGKKEDEDEEEEKEEEEEERYPGRTRKRNFVAGILGSVVGYFRD